MPRYNNTRNDGENAIPKNPTESATADSGAQILATHVHANERRVESSRTPSRSKRIAEQEKEGITPIKSGRR